MTGGGVSSEEPEHEAVFVAAGPSGLTPQQRTRVVSFTVGLCWNNCYLEMDSIFVQIGVISCSDIGLEASLRARDSLSYFELHFGPVCGICAHIYPPNKQLKKGIGALETC